MCLESVTETIKTPTALIQSGWKEFAGTTTGPRFQNFSFNGARNVPLDKWITAETKEVKISTFKKYTAGFHVYEDETELKGRQKRRVYYRNAHTRGRQNGFTIIIAPEIYVPSDPDGWPPQG